MSATAIYAKAPIDVEKREIRLLILEPGSDSDVLQGGFVIESLDYDDLHYTALSYTWSGPNSNSIITIDGLPLPITKNLELALRKVRHPSRSKTLWADAISINQKDNEEKKFQVALMGDIYASATRTWIWLGEESADSNTAIDFMESIKNRKLDILDSSNIPWGAINGLFQREWWTRVWVVQETLMAHRAIVNCGRKQVDFVCFVRLEEFMRYAKDPKTPYFDDTQQLSTTLEASI